MSKFGKRFVSCLLAVMMMLSLSPLSAFASNDGTSSTVNGEQSTTVKTVSTEDELNQAVTSAGSNETTIQLSADITLDATLTIPENAKITLDLNGYAVTVPEATDGRSIYAIDNYGTLTICDTSVSGNGSISARGTENFGTMTLNSGSIKSIDSNGGGAAVWNAGTFYMTGGKLEFTGQKSGDLVGAPLNIQSSGSAIITGGELISPYTCLFSSGNLILKNISLTSETDYWMTLKLFSGSTSYIENVTINTKKGGCLEVNGGQATLKDCTFTQTNLGNPSWNSTAVAVSSNGTVSIESGLYQGTTSAVYIYNSGGTANLNGGSYEGNDANSTVLKADTSTNEKTPSIINVNGGDYTGSYAIASDNAQLSITNGTFSSSPENYVKNGYKAENSNGTWTVSAESPVAQIGDKQYASLEDAINAASSGDTITMLQNAETTDVSISGKSNLTIDGNGYSLYSVNFGGNNNSITIKNVLFTITNQVNVIAINGQNNNNITISGCSFTLTENASAWVAIYVQKLSDGLTIENNTFTLNRPDANNFQCIGFAFTPDMRATDATIKGNTVTANNTTNTAYFVIGGNAASDNQYGLKNLTISNNTLTASNTGELIGARIANSDKLTVNGNIFNCTTGVRLSATNGIASKDITITNNNGSAKTMIELKGAQPIVSWFITDVPADKISFSEGSDKYNIKVAFDANGGNCDVATSVLPLSNGAASMDALPTPTRNGYTFDGWFTAADGGEQVKEDHVFSADTTLYAHWTKISSGGGSTVTPAPTPEPEEPSDSEETVTNPDGSTTTTITKEDGSSSTTTVGTDGTVESEVTVSKDAVDNANGSAVTLPMPEVPVTTDKTTAPTVTVNLPSKDATKVEVPVKDVTAGTVAVLVDADGNETVIKDTVQSDNGITVEVTDGTTIKVVDNSKSFDDVTDNYWGADAIDFATSRELFAGTGESTFSPEGDMTRAMIWSVLARYEGADIPGGTGDTWYAGPQEWAMENGISDGTMANDAMTREQFAAMLYRYVGSPAVSGSVGNYSDADSISSWAQDAMVWAVQQGLIAGMDDGTLNPQGTATRTQVAAIFQRFIENQMA